MPTPFKVLIVDDDPLIHQSVDLMIPKSCPIPWEITHAHGPEDIIGFDFHAALVDMHLKAGTVEAQGLKVIERLHAKNSHIEIVAMSGNLNPELLENCLLAGAYRFLPKPLSPEELTLTLEKIEAFWLLKEAAFSRTHSKKAGWVGDSKVSQEIRRKIAALKGEDGPILIEGDSGVGKEVVAQLLHDQEPTRPWIQINAAAIPTNLFESEFFGHVRGAFTGASQNKMGLAEAAHGGDLFIDEIEALPLDQQAKLLRFLETGEVRRIGAQHTTRVRVRIIAASNKNLQKMVSLGEFREDLLWRICGKKILLPRLAERSEDIGTLANYFLDLQKPKYNKMFSEETLTELKKYSWPGNVRELKRVCEQLCLTSPLPIIRPIDVRRAIAPATLNNSGEDGLSSLDLSLGLNELLQNYEAKIIRNALLGEKDVDNLAKLLKVSRSSLYKKIKDYQIQELS